MHRIAEYLIQYSSVKAEKNEYEKNSVPLRILCRDNIPSRHELRNFSSHGRPPTSRRTLSRKEPAKPEVAKSEDPPEIVGKINDVTVNQGQKVEFNLKVTGSKPLTVTWFRNDTTKLKSSKNSKITFAQGEAKLIIMEADGEDDGEYRIEAVNEFGKATQTARVNVILPEKLQGKVKQFSKTEAEGETVELKKVLKDKRSSVVAKPGDALDANKLGPRGSRSSRGSIVVPKLPTAPVGPGGPQGIPSIVVDGGNSPDGSRRGSAVVDGDPLKRRGSKLPDEDEEEMKYFLTKPQNQVVNIGETMFVECTFKQKPPNVDWYRGAIPMKTDPRVTIVFDPVKLYASVEMKKCKQSDESKFRVQVEDENGEETLEFAGFSVFVKDPKDSGLDFRSLLKHKDHKKRRGTKEDPDWGELNPLEKDQQEYARNRRMSAIDLSRNAAQLGDGKERTTDHWIDELEDLTCQEKESKVELACKYSKPTARVRWYKNKLEIFQGTKYNISSEDGIFRLIVNKVTKDDNARYICSADLKETSCYLTVESKKVEYFFTQKLPKTANVKRKKDLILECMINDPRPDVTWKKNGEKIEYEPDKYEISRRENRCLLKIKNVGKDDAAEFSCEVEGDKTTGKVVVEEPEYDFDKSLTDTDALEKENAEFECEVNDEEAPVEWYREDKKIDINDPKYFCVQDGKKRRLRVNNIGQRDEGIYKCKIVGQDKVTSGKLYVAPEVVIKEQLKNLRKVEGEEAQFVCKVKNPKNYPITWYRNDEEIKPSDKFVITEEGGKATLTIKDLTLDDASEFSCKIGDRSTSAKLQVDLAQRPPVVNLDAVPREITVKAGQNVALDIPYTANPKPTVAWTKNKGQLDPSIKTSQTADKCKLNLEKAKRSDAGEYEIELKNKSGKINVPITLKVIDKPSKPQGPLVVQDVYKDRCRLSWKPPKDDGGLPIEKYIVEAQDVATGQWTLVGKVIDDTQCGVPGLEPGKKYKFRVKAVNSLGESEPLTSDGETLAKDPFDPPGQPGRPEIIDYDKDRAEIKWTPPTTDGGSPILKYVIEKRERGKDWEKVGMVPPSENSAAIPNLEEGKEYEFRVTPVNEAGPGKASEPCAPVKTKARRVKPRIDRNSFMEINTYKNGQEANIEVKFSGEPSPKAVWSKAGKPLVEDKLIKTSTKPFETLEKGENIKQTDQDYVTNLIWRKLTRKDTGKIVITVSNEYGMDRAELELVVFGPPGKPKGPLEVTDIQKDSATIAWKPPADDGGKPITGYTLEKQNVSTGKWEPISGTIPPDVHEFKIPKLKEGEDYKFRVRAENELGPSEPLETEKSVLIKNPFDPSDPPGKPFVVDSDKNFIKIKWEKPKKDGGAPITGYNVERKDPRTGTWSKVNTEPLKEPEFRDDKVQPNKDYQYRVTAENEGGESKPSEPSDLIKARPLKDAPKVDLSLLAGKEIRVRAGDPIKIEVPVSGTPRPNISWSKDKKDLPPSDKARQEITDDPVKGDDKATLTIPASTRADSGKYTIKASNEFGESSGDITVIVLDKPSPPRDLNVSEVFADRCTLDWKPPADDGGAEVTGYIIEKCDEDTGLWLPISDVISGTKHVVKGLKKGKKYKFRVKAENQYGVSDPVETDRPILAKNPYDKPDPPGKPEVTDSDKDFIAIKWEPPAKDGGAPITGYNVERKDPKTGTWKKVNTEPLKKPEFKDKKVQPGKEYEYRVTAENAGGESDPSEASNPIKARPLKAPPKVDLSGLGGRDVRVRAGEPLKLDIPISGAPTPTVTWQKDAKDLPPSERIEQKNGEEEASLHIPVTKKSDNGKYAITVSNPNGVDTGYINVIVLDRPSPPENLQVSDVRAEQCKLSWDPPADDGNGEITGYIVERCQEGTNFWEKVPGNTIGTKHTVRGLEPGKKYKFRVKAENQYGVSDPCETDRSILAKNPFDPPGEPKDLQIDKYDKSSVTLKWKKPNDDGGNSIKGYVIEKCPAKGRGDWTPVNSTPTAGTTFTVPNLTEGSEWEFRVVAVNDAGPGKPSKSTGPHRVRDQVFAAGPPGTPTIDRVSPKAIDLSWEKPLDDGGGKIEGYIVEVKDKDGEWKEVSSIPVKDTHCTVPNLKEGETYQFRVKAVNEAGPGEPSNPTVPVVAEKPKEKPSIDLSGIKDITVRAGQDIKIALPIKGWPVPTATWSLGDNVLDKGGRNKIETSEDQALLVIKDAVRKDTGPYNIVIKNDSGSAEGTVNVTVLDKPSPPEGPLEPVSTSPTEITLEWKPPKDNGGSKIEKYVLEKKPKGSNRWTKVPGTIGPNDTQATAKNLEPGEEYEFRVMAVNENGESDPLVTTEPIVAKYPFDPPGKPGKPECQGTTEDSVTLSWDPPFRDGGRPIKGYVLEKREKGAKKWSKVPAEITDPEFTVKGLVEGRPYEFRVAAINDAGHGEFSEPSEAIKPAPPPSAPRVLDSLLGDVRAKVGEPYKIKIPYKGTPVPDVTWFNGAKQLDEDGRISFEIKDDEVVLLCKSAKKEDTGRISAVLKNVKGSDTAYVNLVVVDKPGAPEGPLEVSKITPESCKLSWKPPKDDGGNPVSHYVVEKKDKTSGKWTPVSRFCKDTECEVNDLEPGETYEFRVSAVNENGQSEPLLTDKPIVAKHPFDPPGKPGKPTIEDADESSVTLSWSKPINDGGNKIKGYVIEAKEKGSNKWTPLNPRNPCHDTTFTAQNLEPNVEYEFRVLAKNEAGLGEPSAPSDAVITKPKPTKASAPGALTPDKVGPHSIDLSWTKPANDGGSPIKGYRLEKKTPYGDWEAVSDAPIVGETATVPDLVEGEEYQFRVAAITDVGVGDFSLATAPIKAEKPKRVPDSPENLQATEVFADHCKLAWLPPSDNGGSEITGYVVEKCLDGTDNWEKVPGIVSGESHVVKGLEPGKKYRFRVKAQNKLGLGEPVETNKAILAKDPYDPPGEPKDPVITKYDKNSVTLKWKEPTDDGGNPIQGYIIEKCPAKGRGDWTPVNSTPTAGTTFTVPNLTEGSEWEFRVVAVNDAGPGKPSKSTGPHRVRDQVFAAGPPGTPQVDEVTPNSVALSWEKPFDDGGGKIDGYIVEMKDKDGEWKEVSPLVKDTKFKVPHLKEGETYQFRVKAVNEAGPGTPSAPTAPVVAEKPAEKPSIDLSQMKDINVKAGQEIKIVVPIKGWPLPTATWELNGAPIEKGGRVHMEVQEDKVILTVKDAARSDTGKYDLKLKNPHGTAEGSLHVNVLDKPAAPEGPLEPVSTSPTEITLEWKPPKDNGGAKIQKYVLEKKPKGSNRWTKVPGTIGPNDTQATAKNLEPGEEYEFRVMAVNENGESDPLVTTEPIVAKYPFNPPGKPGTPECLGTTEDSITLTWEPPTRDGGRPIKSYVVEKREKGSKKWTKVPEEILDNEVTVKGLKEGREYEFRVAAVNDAGPGAFSDASEAIKAAPPPTAPKVLLDPSLSEVRAKVGEPYKIKIPYKGTPVPTVNWFNGPRQINEDGRISFEIKDDEVVLLCKSAEKADAGRISAVLKNVKGSDTAYVNLVVVDKPGAPEGPLEVSKVTPESCKLSWNPPKDNGGDPITNYLVEKKDKTSGRWTPVSRFCKDTECEVNDLDPGETYEFRVSAVNENGQSEPLLTDKPIVAKHPFDTPGKTGTPEIVDVDEGTVTLSWTKPISDGGGKVKADGLDPDKEYEFRVVAKNDAGLGEPSSPSKAVQPKAKPTKASPPGSVKVDKVGPHAIDLSWTKPLHDGGSPIKGYKIEKRTPGGDWESASDTPIFGEQATVSDLNEGETYEFRVAAITDAGTGDFSLATPPVKAEKPKHAPSSPENLQATDIHADHCKLSWLPPSDNGGADITGYVVEKCEEGSSVWEKVPGVVSGESHVVRGLEPGKKYKFRVKAQNKLGLGEPVETNKWILAKNPYDPPGEPKDPLITKYDRNSVTLAWKAPNDDGGNPIEGYIIEKCPAKGRGDWTPVNSTPTAGTTFTVPNLTEGSEWEFRVVAVNDAGPGKPSKSTGPHRVRDQVFAAGAPGTPRVDEISPNSATLSWDKPLDTGNGKIDGYIVEMKDKDGEWKEVSPLVKDNKFKVPHLKEGETYQFRVKAVNEAGPGTPSAPTGPVVAEKPAEKPSIDLNGIKDITVKAGQEIKIAVPIKGWPLPTASWQLGDEPIINGGRVKMETTPDFVYLSIKDASRADTGPYKLHLKNPSGTADCVVNVTVLDKPAAPEGPLEATDTKPTEITLEWKPPKDNGGAKIQKYVLEKKPKGSNRWTKVPGTIGPNDTQATAKNLEPGEEYEFRVMAVNENGESDPLVTTEPIVAKYPFNVPGKPGAPEAVGTTEDSITLSWEPPFKDGGRPIKGYVLEKREAGSKRWSRVSPHDIDDTTFTVKNLIEGKPYEFRVAAVNEAGVGAFAECDKAIKPQAPATAPKIQLDGLPGEIYATEGEPFKIKIPFKGSPVPTAQWFNGSKEILEDDRMKVEIGDGEVTLTCRAAKKDDQGRYSITLKNPKGTDTAHINVNVIGKPGPPEGPLKVSKITPESCYLSWDPPTHDGGRPVTHYFIEKKDKTSGKWTPVSRYCKGTGFEVGDLDEGETYEFRVSAVNELGQGEPLVTDKPIVAKHQFEKPGKTGTPKVEDVDEDSVTLSWARPMDDGGNRVSGYVVEVREKGSDKWKPVNEKNPCKDNRFTVGDLEKGKEYEFRVRAKNLAGLGDPSSPSQTVTPRSKASKASPPGLPSVDKVTKNSVDLSWTKPRSDGGSPIRGYQVEKRLPGGSWEKVNHIPIEGEKIHIPDLDEGKEYEFRVAAVTEVGPGDFSLNTAPVKVCERKAERLPEFLQRPADSTTPLDEDAKFQVVVDGEPFPKVKWFKDGFELKPGAKYRIVEDDGKVQLIVKNVHPDDAGDITCEISNPKGKDSATARLIVQTPPKIDGDIREQSVDKGDTFKLKIPFHGTGPFSYKLRRDNKEIPDGHDRVKIIPYDGYVVLQIRDAEKGDTGKYKLEISNDSGKGSVDIPVKVKAPPGICIAPLQVSEITKNACHLRWKAPEDDGGSKITHYCIERRESGKPYWTTVSTHTRDLEIDVQGLVENKEYLFRVCATNAHGNGEWLEAPNPIVAKMPFDPPGPPGEPEAQEVGGDFVSLSWERPRSDGGGKLLGYFVEKKESTSENWVRVNQVPNPANVFNVSGLIEDREYDFRIFAVNEAGESKPAETGRRIKVTDPKAAKVPEILSGLKPVTCMQGKTARFEATIIGQPNLEVTWYKGSRELFDSAKYETSKEGDVFALHIRDAFGEDADEYCVKATTSAGSRSSRADLTIKSPPKINVPPRFMDVAQFEKGEDVVIKLPFTGFPRPKARWYKNTLDIEESSKYNIELKERHAILTVQKSDRSDNGEYRLSLENDLGSDSAIIKIAVNDVPDPPKLLNVDNLYHDSVMLSWKPPLNDGGGFITQYIVEKREEGMSNWVRCAPTRFAFACIEGLSPSHNYEFRVIAENLYGRSQPSEPVTLKTVSEQEGRQRKGLAPEDENKKKKYTGPKPDNYDRLYHNIWDNNKPQSVDVKSGSSVYDNYDVCEEIGSGAFGRVHRAVEKSTGDNYVVKFVNTPLPADKQTVKNEISILNDLRHPRLLNLHDAYEEPKEMAMVFEYLSGGELFDQISDDDSKLTEADVINYVKQICDGLKFMHDKNIVHLDIKPENLLCPTRKSRDVKLIDFGLSARLDPDVAVKVSTASADFAAPEIVDHEPVGFYTDMWSVGVLTYVLLSGLSPFGGSTDSETLNNVRSGKWDFDSEAFSGISDLGRDFISKLLIKSPQKRMTVHEALEHPWLSQPHPDYTHRIPGSRFSKIRQKIGGKYVSFWRESDWGTPMPAIGRIANYSSLRGQRPREYQIYDNYFDRKEAMPRFVIKPRHCYVQEGGVGSFKCKVMAGSTPLITWYFKGQALNPGLKFMPKYFGTDYELRVGRCKLEDRGTYVVKAVNSYGSREECANLTVEQGPPQPIQRAYSVEPTSAYKKKPVEDNFEKFQEKKKAPSFLFHLRDRFLQEGVAFKLIATVDANPTAKATWYKDGKALHVGGKYNIDTSVGVCTLEVASCDVSDAGKFSCVAENELGSAETFCKISVNKKVDIKPDSDFKIGSVPVSTSNVIYGGHAYSSFADERPHITSATTGAASSRYPSGGYESSYSKIGYNERSRRAGSMVPTSDTTNDFKIKVRYMNDVDTDDYTTSTSRYRSGYSSSTAGSNRSSINISNLPPRPGHHTSVSLTSNSLSSSQGISPYTSVVRKSITTSSRGGSGGGGYGSGGYGVGDKTMYKRSVSQVSSSRRY
ncbi:hypothetical protein HELRODRAFT_191869 [Helobdella robusta]|uniref:non-specific serine/threonine protein kinase n=1 Tax=Helobdella robusta TaxID=6412 RepID=T1FTD4_HELRO|nr:hypothetical protein HELRODRAFT_191869 [Helobdella robusta]ESO03551.1 hypothetical protein HELRODRAFT_191869 [Helobdella robusta]